MIESFTGDIWRFHPRCWVVIPTNAGWNKANDNVMGAGLAADAKRKFKGLASDYGDDCRETAKRGESETVRLYHSRRLIMFVTKPLLPTEPHMSWASGAKLGQVTASAQELAELEPRIIGDSLICIPMVGCGNGGLKEQYVLPVLRRYLNDRFLLVRWGA